MGLNNLSSGAKIFFRQLLFCVGCTIFLFSAATQAADSEYNFGVVSGVLKANDPVSRFVLPSVIEDVVQGAADGVPSSQYLLAVMHANGIGMTKDLAAAKEWHSKALRNKFTYDPFHLIEVTGIVAIGDDPAPGDGVFSVKGIRVGQTKDELLSHWGSLTAAPLDCAALGRDANGYPWESCTAGTKFSDIDWLPQDGSDPVVPGLLNAQGEPLTVGLIPLYFAEIRLRGDVVVDADFKVRNSKTLPNYGAKWPYMRMAYDSCPKVELCERYGEVFSALPDVKVREDATIPPAKVYEKCGQRRLAFDSETDSFLCWAKALDPLGRSDLFLHSNPRFKEPGTITVQEYREMVERKEREKEARAKNDL